MTTQLIITISDYNFPPPALVVIHISFPHWAGFINNTLHSLQGYIRNSNFPFNSKFTFTRIGTFKGDHATHLQQFVAILQTNPKNNAATVCTMREYMHYISGQASNTTIFLFKNTSLKAQPGNSIVSLRAVFSFMCQNQHGFQTGHSDL